MFKYKKKVLNFYLSLVIKVYSSLKSPCIVDISTNQTTYQEFPFHVYLDGRVYNRNMMRILSSAIWGRENVISAIHGFLREKQNSHADDVMMSDS